MLVSSNLNTDKTISLTSYVAWKFSEFALCFDQCLEVSILQSLLQANSIDMNPNGRFIACWRICAIYLWITDHQWVLIDFIFNSGTHLDKKGKNFWIAIKTSVIRSALARLCWRVFSRRKHAEIATDGPRADRGRARTGNFKDWECLSAGRTGAENTFYICTWTRWAKSRWASRHAARYITGGPGLRSLWKRKKKMAHRRRSRCDRTVSSFRPGSVMFSVRASVSF